MGVGFLHTQQLRDGSGIDHAPFGQQQIAITVHQITRQQHARLQFRGAHRDLDLLLRAAFAEHRDEGVNYGGIVAFATLLDDEFLSFAGAVRMQRESAGLQRIIFVGHGQDTGTEWNHQTAQLTRIAAAIHTFMVMKNDARGLHQLRDAQQQLLPFDRMPHDFQFFSRRQRIKGTLEQLVGQPDLADVVQQAGQQYIPLLGLIQPEALGQLPCHVGNSSRMTGQATFTQFDQIGEHLDGGDEALMQIGIGHLQRGGALCHFFLQPRIENP